MSTNKSIPRKDQISAKYLVDHNDRPYFFESLDKRNEPEAGLSDDLINCANISCNLHDIKETFMMLTDEQRKFVMHVYCQYKKNINQVNDNPKIILLGPAGCGKTTIINFINKLITWDGNKTSDSPVKTKVLTCAYTIKSAERIEGFTLNSLLSKIPLRETRSVNEKTIDAKKNIRENCIFFICDEITMVGESLMERVNERLKQLFENDKLYGNRFVLLVGDLYQPPPVAGKLLYMTSKLWKCCEFFELKKIIRQKDEKFIQALNNFKNSEMTEEDFNLLRSREIQNIKEVPDLVIHLFYGSKGVDEYNTKKFNESVEKCVTVRSLNETDEWKPRNLDVKIGMRYMITKNIDESDGLEKGTTGIVKDFEYENDSVVVIWMDFNSTKIGTKTRSDYLSKLKKPDGEKFPWVPIQQSKIIFKLKPTKTKPAVDHIVDKIFPLIVANAIKVYQSQGKTYPDGVCINITEDPNDKLRTDKTVQYLALTRVQKLDDLYIIGPLNFSTQQDNKLITTKNELNRLRTERKLTLAFETFEDKTDDVIILLNTGLTFNEHYEFIASDMWYGNGSLLIFIETNTVDSDKERKIPNFEIAFHSVTNDELKSCTGIICYKKVSKSVEVVDAMSNDANKMYLTLFLYEKYLYILTGNKGDMNDIDFKNKIMQFIDQYVKDERCILFIGALDPSNLTQFLNDEKFGFKLPCDASDKYDMILSRNFNINQTQYGFYEYIPSAHNPVYVKLPPKPVLPIIDDKPNHEIFLTALYNFKNSQMTEEDKILLKSREIQNIDEVPDLVIHLFYDNNRVKEYNTSTLDKSNEKEENVKSLNDSDDGTPLNLRVKIGLRYMITENVDVSDGLANGTTGVVKDFDYDENGSVVVIWMDFHSTKIGKKTRSDFLSKRNKPDSEKFPWVPIQTICKKFPLKVAEAITVHESQGQTYPDGVCIHITDDPEDKLRTNNSMLYVAMSGVQELSKLYIEGTIHCSTIANNNLPGSSIQPTNNENEFNRLGIKRKRTQTLEKLEDTFDDEIIFLNTGSTLNEHFQFMTTNELYDKGSLLIFTETNTIGLDEIVIPNFEIAYRSNYEGSFKSGGGIICYKKASKSFERVEVVLDHNNKMHLSVLLYEKYLYIVTGVMGDLMDFHFINAINNLINRYVRDKKCIFFLGNLDSNLTRTLTEFLNDDRFGMKLSYEASDRIEEVRQFDMIFTQNFKQNQRELDVYIPRTLKSINVKLPPMSSDNEKMDVD